MQFIATRNSAPQPRFKRIAWDYKKHGETWRVRWDYAFFQMVVETNYLLFRRGDGKPGDVKPRQNNFAGLGTTGGGVPGDSYGDVSTGVLAQIQHLVVYSGERIDKPVGPRTRLTQDDIVSWSKRLSRRRAVTFQDLAGRWAADRRYGRTIESIAARFSDQFCKGGEADRVAAKRVEHPWRTAIAPPPAPKPAKRPRVDRGLASLKGAPEAVSARPRAAPVAPAAVLPSAARAAHASGQAAAASPGQVGRGTSVTSGAQRPPTTRAAPSGPGTASNPGEGQPAKVAVGDAVAMAPAHHARCRIQIASFGGSKALLIRAVVGGETQLTALRVLPGFEQELSRSFIAAHAPGGTSIGEFASSDAALKHAYQLCRPALQPG